MNELVYYCEKCGKNTEVYFTVDLTKSENAPDYYDVCEECFDAYVALMRKFFSAHKGADDE